MTLSTLQYYLEMIPYGKPFIQYHTFDEQIANICKSNCVYSVPYVRTYECATHGPVFNIIMSERKGGTPQKGRLILHKLMVLSKLNALHVELCFSIHNHITFSKNGNVRSSVYAPKFRQKLRRKVNSIICSHQHIDIQVLSQAAFSMFVLYLQYSTYIYKQSEQIENVAQEDRIYMQLRALYHSNDTHMFNEQFNNSKLTLQYA